MASIIITKPKLDPALGLTDPAFKTKLEAGMTEFGTKFEDLYNPDKDYDALIDTFVHIHDKRDDPDLANGFRIYAISPTNTGVKVFRLLDPRYNDEETTILFKVRGKGRRFKLNIREDKRFKNAPTELTGGRVFEASDPTGLAALVKAEGLAAQTPLWLYCLLEARQCHNGQRLGPFASRIVAETIHASIEASGSGIIENGRVSNFNEEECIANDPTHTLYDVIAIADAWTPQN